ncbi:hypothetical protein J4429_06225 [Candidatus Pacearchaeota archaeon]|nr:hypothetical protein [Candidatus Pacearchaeota archaeon]
MQVPKQIFCLIPLFDLTLGGLKRLKEYVKSLSPEEVEAIGSISSGGSGKKAFHNVSLENLLEELGASEINNPDVKLRMVDGELVYEYESDKLGEDFAPSDNEEKQGLIRNSKTLLRNICWVDSAVRDVYDIVLNHQREYLTTNDPSNLQPLKFENIANKMGVSISTVSRLMKGKFVRSLDGQIMPLKSLVLQEDTINRLRAYEKIGSMIKDGSYPGDNEALKQIYERTGGDDNAGVHLARRTLTKYRELIEEKMFKDVYGIAFYALSAALNDKVKLCVRV